MRPMFRCLVIALMWFAAVSAVFAGPAAERTYKVREGDTLGAIAKKFGVSVAGLTSANQMADPDELREGQVLRIPAASDKPAAPARSYLLPASTKAALDKIRVVPGRWRYIVIHHSASTKGTPKSMDSYHRQRGMENGLAYHFVIGNGIGMGDGELFTGMRWRGQLNGGHLASESLNAKSIGICLVGNFENSRPSSRQMQSLYAITGYLRQRCKLPVSAVKLHRQINTKPTECPGRLFPLQSLLQNI